MNGLSKIETILDSIPTPCYVCEEALLEENLKILDDVQQKSGAKILLALKGFSFYRTFDLIKEYLYGCSASGLYEAMLADEEMKKEIHTYSPAYKEKEIGVIAEISDHLIFNSFNQWQKYKDIALPLTSCGLRINPEVSSSPTDLYNPCSPYSRLGITKAEFKDDLIEGIEGLHFHALCEQNADSLEKVLQTFEKKFGYLIPQMKWLNFGGGHLITSPDYDREKLISLIKDFKERYNDIEIYLEPGEAVGRNTGVLVASVLDIIHNEIDIAILDTSAEAHMPDTIIMPYRPDVRNSAKAGEKKYTYRLGGNTCLAGDIMGDYSFDEPLKVGDKIIFEDQMHYTIVKNTAFNGIKLPSLAILNREGEFHIIKEFGYVHYKRRL